MSSRGHGVQMRRRYRSGEVREWIWEDFELEVLQPWYTFRRLFFFMDKIALSRGWKIPMTSADYLCGLTHAGSDTWALRSAMMTLWSMFLQSAPPTVLRDPSGKVFQRLSIPSEWTYPSSVITDAYPPMLLAPPPFTRRYQPLDDPSDGGIRSRDKFQLSLLFYALRAVHPRDVRHDIPSHHTTYCLPPLPEHYQSFEPVTIRRHFPELLFGSGIFGCPTCDFESYTVVGLACLFLGLSACGAHLPHQEAQAIAMQLIEVHKISIEDMWRLVGARYSAEAMRVAERRLWYKVSQSGVLDLIDYQSLILPDISMLFRDVQEEVLDLSDMGFIDLDIERYINGPGFPDPLKPSPPTTNGEMIYGQMMDGESTSEMKIEEVPSLTKVDTATEETPLPAGVTEVFIEELQWGWGDGACPNCVLN